MHLTEKALSGKSIGNAEILGDGSAEISERRPVFPGQPPHALEKSAKNASVAANKAMLKAETAAKKIGKVSAEIARKAAEEAREAAHKVMEATKETVDKAFQVKTDMKEVTEKK